MKYEFEIKNLITGCKDCILNYEVTDNNNRDIDICILLDEKIPWNMPKENKLPNCKLKQVVNKI